MKIFTIDVKWQDYKPSNVLDWLGIDYTSIKSLKSIPNRPNDICLASQKQFGDGTIERFDWNKGIPNAIEELSSKFKKVILINDDYTGQWPKKVGNTYVLGLELKTFDRKGSSKFRQLQNNDKYYFNYVYYRSFYEKSKYVDNPSDYPKLIQSMKDTIREKAYLNMNKYPKSHRLGIIIKLLENDIFDLGYNSMLCAPMDYKDFQKRITDIDTGSYNYSFLDIDKKTMDMVNERLPIILQDEEKIEGSPGNYTGADTVGIPYDYMLNSYFTLVTESHNREVDTFITTEKLTKPLLGMHPFILLGQPYTLKHLKDKGFETFSEVIDESYDNEVDDTIRFSKVVNECNNLFKNNTQKDLHNLYYDVLYDKLEHNYYNYIKVIEKELQIIKDIIDDKI